jgi:PAS domain S-box-containing protein
MENLKAIHVQPCSRTTMWPTTVCRFPGCIMPVMASVGQGSDHLNAQLLVDSIPALIHTSRPDGYLDYFNKPWLEYLGVTLDKVVGWNWTAYVHPDDVEGIVAKWRACLATGEIFEYETRVRRANGDFRWMFHRKVPLRDANGNIVKWYGSSLDIEERKTAEEGLRNSQAYLAEAQRLSHTGSFGWKPDTGEIVWSDETYRIFEYDRSVKPTIDSVVQRVHPEDRGDFESVINRALTGAADFEHAYRLLLPDGRVKHVHAIAHTLQDEPRNREFVGAVTDITERKTSEERVRRLIEAGILGIYFATVEGGIIEANQAFLQLLQYDRQDLAAGRLRWADITPAEWRERDERSMAEFLATGVFQAYEKEYFRKDRSRVPVLVGGARMQSPNEGVVFVLDLSEQKRAEEKIRRSESYLAEAQRLSQTGSWAWSPDDDIRYWSEECYRVLNFDLQDGLPRFEQFFQRIHPDDQAGFRELIETAIRNKVEWEADYRIVHAGGAIRDIHSIGHPVFSPSGELVEFTGTVIDVTERKRAEDELRRSEMELRQILDLVPQLVVVIGAGGERLYANRIGLDYIGLNLEEWRQTPGNAFSFPSFFHPDDRERAARTYSDNARAGGSAFELELRLRRHDGAYRWFLVRFSPLRDEQGRITRWYSSLTDIEDRKQTEDKVREQEAELRQIVDLAPQQVRVYGPGGERLYANRIALDYYGASLEEWRQTPGHSFRSSVFVHPDDQERAVHAFDANSSSGSAYELELRVRGADGNYHWFLVRHNPLRDDKGQVKRWYVALTDIDERKRAEERLQQENVALREEIDKASMFEEIVGASPVLKAVLSRISKVAPSDSTVLITGETGTGKELVARAIHRRSDRASRPFVSVNCAAIPRDLIASELFGHEKGAFTGAIQQRLGRFELANGGTLFLDEVGELPLETQIALLRVLQEHEFERVGGSRRIPADVRVIAATNRELHAAISAGSFRSDLFYRLNVFPIEIPSLRERNEDIPLLVEYFVDRYARKAGKNIKRVNKKTLELLQSYPWPGNIRELQNVIERSLILCETEIFSIDENWLTQPPPLTPESKQQVGLPRRLLVQEKDMIEAALKDTRGRVSGPAGAAARLGIPRSTLESKIRSLKINKNRFKT